MISGDDTIVFNWVHDLPFFRPFRTSRVYFFAQDAFQTHKPSEGVRYIAVSRMVQSYLEGMLGRPEAIPLCGNFVDGSVFRPGKKVPRTAAYFSRRGMQFVETLIQRVPELKFVPVIGGEQSVAGILARCEYFVFPSQGIEREDGRMSGEAFPLPPLEAMASGCVVVGFAAGGGHEYMLDNENCLLAKEGDERHLLERCREGIVIDHRPLVAGAKATAKRFAPIGALRAIAATLGMAVPSRAVTNWEA